MSLILVIIMIVTLFLYLIRKINEIRQLHGIVIPESMVSYRKTKNKTRKNAIVEYQTKTRKNVIVEYLNKEERYSRVPRKNSIVEYLDYLRYSRVPRLSDTLVTQLKGSKGDGYSRVPRLSDTRLNRDMQAAKRREMDICKQQSESSKATLTCATYPRSQ